jgi:hypothetical protein
MGDQTSALAWATIVLAVFTALMAIATVWLALEARWGSYRQIRVQTWLVLEARFYSNAITQTRKRFAEECDHYDPKHHGEMHENVLDLFESIATLYYEGMLDKKLADSTFSWEATRWWEAAKLYIDNDRRRNGDDRSLYCNFEKFAKEMKDKHCEKITDDDLKKFLDGEKEL